MLKNVHKEDSRIRDVLATQKLRMQVHQIFSTDSENIFYFYSHTLKWVVRSPKITVSMQSLRRVQNVS